MMSSCASIQVNIDSGDEATLARRWDLAHRIGPAMAATFAVLARVRCTAPSGWPRGTPWTRRAPSRCWRRADSPRTGPTTCSRRALMLVHEDDDSCEPVAVPITFGEWIDEGIAGRRATLADLEYHCTTLFPPVRPRGWLEVRWLDCLPAGLAEVASAAVTALLIDEEAGDGGARGVRRRRQPRVVGHHREPRHAGPRAGRGRRLAAHRSRRGRSSASSAPRVLGRGRRRRRRALAGQGSVAGRRPGGAARGGCHGARPGRSARPRCGRERHHRRAGRRPRRVARSLPRHPRAVRRDGAATPARHPDVAAALGPRPRGELRGHLARPRARRRSDAHRASTTSTTPSSSRATCGRPCRCSTSRPPAPTATPCAVAPSSSSTTADLAEDGAVRLTRDGFVHRMVAQHEHQHAETLLAAIQLLPPDEGHVLTAPPTPAARVTPPAEVLVPGRHVPDGQRRPRRARQRAAGARGRRRRRSGSTRHRSPTASTGTSSRTAGTTSPRWWSDSGWKWRQEAALVAPQFWRRDGDGWARLRFGTVEPLPDDEPVQHVGWYEADAYARWAGRRLPDGGRVGEGRRVRSRHGRQPAVAMG